MEQNEMKCIEQLKVANFGAKLEQNSTMQILFDQHWTLASRTYQSLLDFCLFGAKLIAIGHRLATANIALNGINCDVSNQNSNSLPWLY